MLRPLTRLAAALAVVAALSACRPNDGRQTIAAGPPPPPAPPGPLEFIKKEQISAPQPVFVGVGRPVDRTATATVAPAVALPRPAPSANDTGG